MSRRKVAFRRETGKYFTFKKPSIFSPKESELFMNRSKICINL